MDGSCAPYAPRTGIWVKPARANSSKTAAVSKETGINEGRFNSNNVPRIPLENNRPAGLTQFLTGDKPPPQQRAISWMQATAHAARCDCSPRTNDAGALRAALLRHFRVVSRSKIRSGDVLLLQPGDRKYHLAVRTETGYEQAHASIRCMV